jgi:uncharacterized membrane protein
MHGEHARHGSSTETIPSGGICYVFGVLFPLIYLLSRRRNHQSTFLRFHCIQCLILFLLWVPFMVLRIGPNYISSIGFLLGLVGWLLAMIQAKRKKLFHLPLIGWVAERLTCQWKRQRESGKAYSEWMVANPDRTRPWAGNGVLFG